MVVPTQHTACPCNTAAPIKAKKERFDPLPGFKGKGRLTLNAVPCVIEVITNPNYTQTQMAQKLGMTQGYISTLRKKHAAQEDLVQFPKPPKGKVLRCRFIRTARNIIGKDPNASAADVASGIWRRWKVPMSRQTAWRLITKDLGKAFKLKKKKPAKGVPVTRLKFATELRKLIERENPIFLWTDETYAGTRDSVRGQYVDEGKEAEPAGRERWIPKVHTWGVLWEDGFQTFELPEGEGPRGGLTADQYVEFVSVRLPIIARQARKFAGERPVYWMQDGASVHKPEVIKKMCADNGIRFLEGWPAHSPDMNPIENAWAILKAAMSRELLLLNNTKENRLRLKRLTKDHTLAFKKRHVTRLCDVRKRLETVIGAGGTPTKY
jgi:transposase